MSLLSDEPALTVSSRSTQVNCTGLKNRRVEKPYKERIADPKLANHGRGVLEYW